jgi:hypothetical protein
MQRHPDSDSRRQLIRSIGRVGLALAAGGAYAALAWDPRPAANSPADAVENQTGFYSAERQGIVKEDDAAPHLDAALAWPERQNMFGLVQTASRKEVWANHGGNVAGGPTVTTAGSLVPPDQSEAIKSETTVVAYPRAPP